MLYRLKMFKNILQLKISLPQITTFNFSKINFFHNFMFTISVSPLQLYKAQWTIIQNIFSFKTTVNNSVNENFSLQIISFKQLLTIPTNFSQQPSQPRRTIQIKLSRYNLLCTKRLVFKRATRGETGDLPLPFIKIEKSALIF